MPSLSAEFWIGTAVAILALLIGLAVTLAMDAKTKGEFWVAVTCFLVSAFVIIYGLEDLEMLVSWSKPPRIFVFYLLFAFVLLITGETIRWAHSRHLRASKFSENSPKAEPPAPPNAPTPLKESPKPPNHKPEPAKRHREQPTDAQMRAIEEVDSFFAGQDETALRTKFGFQKMQEANIRANIAVVRHFKEGAPLNLQQFALGPDTLLDSALAEGHIRRVGGALFMDPPDGERIFQLFLAQEYSDGKKKLFQFETSSELPTPIIQAVKQFDDSIYQNANSLLHVLNTCIKTSPDYFLRYDDPNSQEYFHKIDALWLDQFKQLRPAADWVQGAIRRYLEIP